MGAAAQICKVSLPIERKRFVGWNLLDNLGFVLLAQFTKIRDGLRAPHGEPFHCGTLFRQRLHLFLDPGEIILRKTRAVGEIVIEPILNHGADGDLCLRKQLLDRLRKQVSAGMADDLESFGIFGRNDAQRRVCFNPVRSIDQCAVHLASQSGLGEAGTDICRNF